MIFKIQNSILLYTPQRSVIAADYNANFIILLGDCEIKFYSLKMAIIFACNFNISYNNYIFIINISNSSHFKMLEMR